jgi:3-oxoacyl-[acyl-carrier-protein] synthase-3
LETDAVELVVVPATNEKDRGIISTNLYSDGEYNDILNTSGGTSFSQNAGYINMLGKEVFKHAIEKMSSCVVSAVEKANLKIADIDWLIPHQANARILAGVAKKIGIAEEKVVITVDKHANTSAASIPLALSTMIDKIRKGDIVVMEALGGGLTWGSVVIRW